MSNRAHGLAHVRDAVLSQALRLDARFHDRFPPGELMSRSSSDAEVVSRVLDASGHTVGYLVTVVGASIVLLLIDATLALLILAPLPLLILGFWRYARRYSTRTKLFQEELGHASALVEETVAGIRVIKGLGAGAALSRRFHDSSERVRDRALDVVAVDAVFLPALELVPLLDQGRAATSTSRTRSWARAHSISSSSTGGCRASTPAGRSSRSSASIFGSRRSPT